MHKAQTTGSRKILQPNQNLAETQHYHLQDLLHSTHLSHSLGVLNTKKEKTKKRFFSNIFSFWTRHPLSFFSTIKYHDEKIHSKDDVPSPTDVFSEAQCYIWDFSASVQLKGSTQILCQQVWNCIDPRGAEQRRRTKVCQKEKWHHWWGNPYLRWADEW